MKAVVELRNGEISRETNRGGNNNQGYYNNKKYHITVLANLTK